MNNNIEFLGNHILMGKIQILSGMHIGGNQDKLEIGGIDSPIIRDPITNYPYIPGSTIKGKLRMITEFSNGKVGSDPKKGHVCDCGELECSVCRIFGTGKDPKKIEKYLGPTRIIVRDSYPDEATINMWERMDSDYLYTEAKTENNINRLTSEANPRTIERVVRGSYFNFHITIGKYKIAGIEDKDEDVDVVLQSMKILEDIGIGGSVSRGYGRIRFLIKTIQFVSVDDYKNNTDNFHNSRYELLDNVEKKSLLTLSDYLKK